MLHVALAGGGEHGARAEEQEVLEQGVIDTCSSAAVKARSSRPVQAKDLKRQRKPRPMKG